VLLVHGIDDSGKAFATMRERLLGAGFTDVEALDFLPNDGSSGIPALAEQVNAAVERLRARTGAAKVDVVAFSMGTLATRWYLMRLGGKQKVRTFVSLSGPHHGTVMGYLRWNSGAEQMRPGSGLLEDLAKDEGEWGEVKVASLWTPLDLMIVPASSSRLKGAVQQTFPVLAHPLMLSDARVLGAVEQLLLGHFVTGPPSRAPDRP
jgi:triacylglycerol esterase/lipase EstA (alpha/beta hydrolase family)